MFGSVGGPEILLIFVLALLLFGPRKLPEIGRALGKTVAEFRKATAEFRSTLEREVEMEKLKETGGVLRSAGTETSDAVKGRGLLGEITAALRPPAAADPYRAGGERATEEPPVLHGGASPAEAPVTAPVPFADESDPRPSPGAAPAPTSSEDATKRQEH
jgi:TatA/E family protein of Tat protein translocase